MELAKTLLPLAAVFLANLVCQAVALEFFPEVSMEVVYLTRRSDINKKCRKTNFEELGNGHKVSLCTSGLCDFIATVSADKVVLALPKTPCLRPSLKQVCAELLEATNLGPAMTYFNLELLSVQRIEYSKATKNIKISSNNVGVLRWLIYFPMAAERAIVNVSFDSRLKEPTFDQVEIEVKGKATIIVLFEVSISKKKGSTWYTMHYEDNSTPIDLVKWVNAIQLYVTGLAVEEDGFNFDQLNDHKIHSPQLNGVADNNNNWQMVLRGSRTDRSNIFKVHGADLRVLITNRKADGTYLASLVVDFPRETTNALDVLLPVLTKAPLRGFPLFKRVQGTKFGLTVSASDLDLFDHEIIRSEVSHVIHSNDEQRVPAGVNIKYLLNLKDNIKTGCIVNNSEVRPLYGTDGKPVELVTMTAAVKSSGVSFKFPDNVSTSIGPILKCLAPHLDASMPKSLFPDSNSTVILTEIQFTPGRKNVTFKTPKKEDAKEKVSTFSKRNVTFFFRVVVLIKTSKIPIANYTNGALHFNDTQLAIQNVDSGLSWEFVGTTGVNLFGVDILFQVKKTFNFKKDAAATPYKFIGMVPSMSLGDISKLFDGVNETVKAASSITTTLTNYKIKDLTFEIELDTSGTRNNTFRVRGRPFLVDATTTPHFEFIYWWSKPKDKPRISGGAFGVWFSGLSLDSILGLILGSSYKSGVQWLSNMQAILLICGAQGTAGSKSKAEIRAENRTDRALRTTGNRLPSLQETVAAAEDTGTRKSSVRNSRSISPWAQKYRSHLLRAEVNKVKKDNKSEEAEPPTYTFRYPGLVNTVIRKGFSGMLWWGMPMIKEDCLNDSMCLWLLEKFGTSFEMQLILYIGGKTDIELSAAIRGNIKVSEYFQFQRLMFKVKLAGRNSCIRIECDMTLNYPPLTNNTLYLNGAIQIKFSGTLNLEFSLGGIIMNPFKFQYAAFGNILVAFGISKTMPMIELGCEFWIGRFDGETDINKLMHLLKFKIYVGLNPADPQDIYFYAQLNKLTLIDVLKAFKVEHGFKDGDILAETGFPGPFTFSFSLREKYVPSIGLYISSGLYLNGTIRILGWEMWGKLLISTNVVEIDINMDPISWAGGMLKLQRSSSDAKRGPKLYFRASLDQPSYRANISGYSFLLGMSSETHITINENIMEFNMTGRPWPGILGANLYAKAIWDPSANIGFTVNITFSDAGDQIAKAILEYIDRAATAVNASILVAKKKLKEAENAIAVAQKKAENLKKSLADHKIALEKKSKELEAEKANYNVDCSAECPKGCMPFLDWNPCAWKIWGHCIGSPTWNNCRWNVSDPICLAKCELKKLANKFVVWIKQVGVKISTWLSDIYSGLVTAVQGLMELGKAVVNLASEALTYVNSATQWFLSYAAKGLITSFRLRHLTLGMELGTATGICGWYSIDCVLFGASIKASDKACLSELFASQVAEGTSEKKYPGINKTDENLEKLAGKIKDVDNAEAQFGVEKAKTETEVKEGFDEANSLNDSKVLKRFWIPGKPIPRSSIPTVRTKEQTKYLEQAEEEIPPYILQRDSMNDMLENSSPWAYARHFDFASVDLEPKLSKDSEPARRNLEIDKEGVGSCLRFKRAMESYAELSNGLVQTSHNMASQLKAFNLTRRSYLEGMGEVKAQIKDLETRHNLTEYEKSDAYFWHDKLSQGFNDWEERSKRALDHQHDYAMPILRGQLNALLRREKKTDLDTYLKNLHSHAVDAFKRTVIPSPDSVNGEEKLDKIRKSLVYAVNSDTISHEDAHKQLRGVQADIRSLRHLAAACHASG